MSEPNYEQMVREAWEEAANLEDHSVCCKGTETLWAVSIGNDEITRQVWAATPEAAWREAWEFTESRLEEVRRVEEEIKEISADVAVFDKASLRGPAPEAAIYSRTLQRLQAIRDGLKRGLKVATAETARGEEK